MTADHIRRDGPAGAAAGGSEPAAADVVVRSWVVESWEGEVVVRAGSVSGPAGGQGPLVFWGSDGVVAVFAADRWRWVRREDAVPLVFGDGES